MQIVVAVNSSEDHVCEFLPLSAFLKIRCADPYSCQCRCAATAASVALAAAAAVTVVATSAALLVLLRLGPVWSAPRGPPVRPSHSASASSASGQYSITGSVLGSSVCGDPGRRNQSHGGCCYQCRAVTVASVGAAGSADGVSAAAATVVAVAAAAFAAVFAAVAASVGAPPLPLLL